MGTCYSVPIIYLAGKLTAGILCTLSSLTETTFLLNILKAEFLNLQNFMEHILHVCTEELPPLSLKKYLSGLACLISRISTNGTDRTQKNVQAYSTVD